MTRMMGQSDSIIYNNLPSNMENEEVGFVIPLPDDFHHHLRDGDKLLSTVEYASRSFGRVVAMPNLSPPVLTVKDALEYKNRILAAVPESVKDFQPLMVLYLTDDTT
jgi:dihydroorotase